MTGKHTLHAYIKPWCNIVLSLLPLVFLWHIYPVGLGENFRRLKGVVHLASPEHRQSVAGRNKLFVHESHGYASGAGTCCN